MINERYPFIDMGFRNLNVWGVRLPVEAEEIHNPSKWAGENRLGFILTTLGKYFNSYDTWSSNAQS